jgi:hypothetical protein
MKHYTIDGKTTDYLPDPCQGVSPMTEARFVSLGGTIEDDGQLTPEERVCEEFADLIEDLASKTDKITPEEFLQAAANGISSNLIDFARERGVPEAVITEGRTRVVEIMADAMRFGMTWAELIQGVIPK